MKQKNMKTDKNRPGFTFARRMSDIPMTDVELEAVEDFLAGLIARSICETNKTN